MTPHREEKGMRRIGMSHETQMYEMKQALKKNARSWKHIPTQAAPSPCEDNGCIDIENCDEICKHSRIFSPAWVAEHDKKLSSTIRNQILEEIEDKCITYPSELGDMILLSDVQSIRIPSIQEQAP